MNEKPEIQSASPPDLAAAIRQARIENAERAAAIADLREIEIGRLTLLETALRPVVAQAPPDVDLFDLALAPGDHPRLFVDMIAFADMAHDRRTYRFLQDTRNGRILIAESQSVDAIAAAVANYVARRLIERERALASNWGDREPPQASDKASGAHEGRPRAHASNANGPRAWPLASTSRAARPAAYGAVAPAAAEGRPPPRRRFVQRLGDALSLFLMMLGSITLALLIAFGGYLAWTMRLHDLWDQWTAASPF